MTIPSRISASIFRLLVLSLLVAFAVPAVADTADDIKAGAAKAAKSIEAGANKAAASIEAGASSAGEYLGDASITAVIKGKFLREPGLDSLNISVQTADGMVTLSGLVDHPAQKSLAERIAKEVDDVKGVVNVLMVKK